MGYFSGQGKVEIAPLINGVPGLYRWVGNVPDFKLTFDTDKLEHKESWSGQRLLDKVITKENKAKVTAELEEWSKENVALAVRGEATNIAGGVVTAINPDVSPAVLPAGGIWALKHQKVSLLTIKDSADPQLTVDPADYVLDPVFGTITIVDSAGYTLPFKANYTYEAVENVAFFTQPITEVAVRFEGINTADQNKKVLVEAYRIALDPSKELGLINDEFGTFQLEGNALVDSSKPSDPVFGYFGRMVYL